MGVFQRQKRRYKALKDLRYSYIPQSRRITCPLCKGEFERDVVLDNLSVCPACGYLWPLTPQERIELVMDYDSFQEFNGSLTTANPLSFPGYEEKLQKAREVTGSEEAVVTGSGLINGRRCILCVMDGRFMMGSMSSLVGEKITLAIEKAREELLPLIIFSSSGGARMQEGILSLMQMAKTSAALARFDEEGGLYISVLTNPTTGGVTASFAMLGDIILAEPRALIGFAGPRVIRDTIRQDLPKGFQTAEFQMEHGFVDGVVERTELKDTLSRLLKLHSPRKGVYR